MYMKDWVERLDDFVKMTGNPVLEHAGVISHQQAIEKAHTEYEKYNETAKNKLSAVEKHFVAQIENTAKKLGKGKQKRSDKPGT